MNIETYWKVTLRQDAEAMRTFFDPSACIRWHNTNEQFSVEEFIQANCEYPDQWDGTIERTEQLGNLIITVTHVFATNRPLSFHVTSFIKLKQDRILSIDEYWGDDGIAPQWRLDKHLGKEIDKKEQSFDPQELLDHIDELHTTKLGADRIKKNLALDIEDVVSWCKEQLHCKDCQITRKGKNWYVSLPNSTLTINRYRYTIITAHNKNPKVRKNISL